MMRDLVVRTAKRLALGGELSMEGPTLCDI